MKSFLVRPIPCLEGKFSLPGDKSIAHRSIILSAIASGKTTIGNFPFNKDCLATLACFRKLGISFSCNQKSKTVVISGKGLYGLEKPVKAVFVGESGTTLRLLLGVLAGSGFRVKLIAGKSLSKRPMLRVTGPLRRMGAEISARHLPGTQPEEYPPITIKGGKLKPITYRMPLASAQVKSAILLAGLYANGTTKIIEPVKTRDHTERMLKLFKANIRVLKDGIAVKGRKELSSPGAVRVPGDISSASFFMVLAAILPKARIIIKDVSLNPSRLGIIDVLRRMKADILVSSHKLPACPAGRQRAGSEPVGDIIVKSSKLRGIVIKKKEIPSLIDELPILMVAASYANSRSIFESVEELRVKETDRIHSMCSNLSKMGAKIKVCTTAKSERIIIKGSSRLIGAKVKSFGDHRTAMSMIVAGLAAIGKTAIDDVICIRKSFPEFLKILNTLGNNFH